MHDMTKCKAVCTNRCVKTFKFNVEICQSSYDRVTRLV